MIMMYTWNCEFLAYSEEMNFDDLCPFALLVSNIG